MAWREKVLKCSSDTFAKAMYTQLLTLATYYNDVLLSEYICACHQLCASNYLTYDRCKLGLSKEWNGLLCNDTLITFWEKCFKVHSLFGQKKNSHNKAFFK